MNFDNLRQLEIAATCSLLGLERDPNDFKQFLGDGFRISFNGLKWYDHNANKGGGGAIDLTMHVKQLTFMVAANYLSGIAGEIATATPTNKTKTRASVTKPPIPDTSKLPSVKAYLTGKRGLNHDLVQWCIDKGMIYADSRSNCVFRYGTQGAELRGTGDRQWRGIFGVIEYGFILPAKKAAGVALLESAIDALSYRQLHRDVIAVSIAGNGNHKVINQAVSIAKAKDLPVLSAFDNDDGGDIADSILAEFAALNDVKVVQDRPEANDWNDNLTKG